MKSMKLFLIVALCWLIPGIARAQFAEENKAPTDGPSYVVIKGGLFYPVGRFSLENFNSPAASSLDMQNGQNGEIALGQYNGDIAAELGLGFFKMKGSAPGEPGSAELKAIPLFITWKVLSSPGGAFKPYVEFGVGGYYTTLDVSGTTGSFTSQSKTTYGVHGGLGFNIDLGDAMFLGLEGRYVWVRRFAGQNTDLNGVATSINIGFKY